MRASLFVCFSNHLSLLKSLKSSFTSTSPVSTSCRISRLEIGPGVSDDDFRMSATRTSVRPKNSTKHIQQSKPVPQVGKHPQYRSIHTIRSKVTSVKDSDAQSIFLQIFNKELHRRIPLGCRAICNSSAMLLGPHGNFTKRLTFT